MPCLVEAFAKEQIKKKAQNNEIRSLKELCKKRSACFDLSNNDYLSLSKHPLVIEAGINAIKKYGTSSCGSPVVSAYLKPHRELQEHLCNWVQFPHALLWSSGHTANESIMSLIPKKGDILLADEQVHYSILSGALQSKARLIRFKHNDLNDLEYYLQKYPDHTKILVTESLYSMDGDYPDLKQLARLKERYGFFWILDEAHALGWYGPQGQGLAHHYGVASCVDILIATLGKTLASQGAFSLFKSTSIYQYTLNYSKAFMYTTYPAPVLAATANRCIKLIKNTLCKAQNTWHQKSSNLRNGLIKAGIDTYQGTSPIVPIILKTNDKAMNAHQTLQAKGIHTACIRPPTVAQGTSRLRLSLNIHVDTSKLLNRLTILLKPFF